MRAVGRTWGTPLMTRAMTTQPPRRFMTAATPQRRSNVRTDPLRATTVVTRTRKFSVNSRRPKASAMKPIRSERAEQHAPGLLPDDEQRGPRRRCPRPPTSPRVAASDGQLRWSRQAGPRRPTARGCGAAVRRRDESDDGGATGSVTRGPGARRPRFLRATDPVAPAAKQPPDRHHAAQGGCFWCSSGGPEAMCRDDARRRQISTTRERS